MFMEQTDDKPLQRAMMGAGILRVYVDEMCYVDTANPGSSFGYPKTAIVAEDRGSGPQRNKIAVFKFASVPPLVPSPPVSELLVVGSITESSWSAPLGTRIDLAHISLTAIVEDFDPSTLTLTDYNALLKGSVIHSFVIFDIDAAGTDNRTGTDFLGFLSLATMRNDLNINVLNGNVYGFSIVMSFSAGGGAAVSVTFTRTSFGLEPNGYQTFIEWNPS